MIKILALLFSLFSVFSQSEEPVKWKYELDKIENNKFNLTFSAEIIDGWKLYSQYSPIEGTATEFIFLNSELSSSEKEKFNESEPIVGYDNVFDIDLPYFINEASFNKIIDLNNLDFELLKVEIVYSSCDDELCVFRNETFNIPIDPSKKINITENVTLDDINKYNQLKYNFKRTELISNDISNSINYIEIFIFGLIAGFLALLTPCIFPMIPLTVSYFLDEDKLKYGSLKSASLYGLFIILIYLGLSFPFHVFDNFNPNILNSIGTNIYVNSFFFVVFIIFAISFFGYFDLTIPNSIISKSDLKSSKSGTIGIFFMALTLALVSFSCTGPILGSLLAGTLSGNESGAMQLSIGMLGFGVSLGLPFTLLAFYPKYISAIPSSGVWLKKMKVTLGFLELALAFKFLSNADLVGGWDILKREVFVFIWIIIFLSLSLYHFGSYFGKPKFNFRSISGWVSLIFSIFLISGLYNSNNVKLLSGILPPEFYSIQNSENQCPLGLNCYKSFEEGRSYALENQKLVLLDFTGWACANCRRMEENVWSKPGIYNLLDKEFVIISLYVDDRSELDYTDKFKYINDLGKTQYVNTVGQKWSVFQFMNFKSASQPYYVAMKPTGEILTEPIQYASETKFKDWLDLSIIESSK